MTVFNDETFPAILVDALVEVGGNAVADGTLSADDVTVDTRLLEDLELDSLTMMEIVCYLEDRFPVRFATDRREPMWTVGDALTLLRPVQTGLTPTIRIPAR